MKLLNRLTILFVLFVISSCVNEITEEETDVKNSNVTLHIQGFNMYPFHESSSRATNENNVTHIDICIFDEQDNKILKINQKQGDKNFASPSLKLGTGNYKLVIIAHCGSGTATITSPSQVTFSNNKITDTFYYCNTLAIDEHTSSVDITLQRSVAMVRFILTDTKMPTGFTQLQFYYTGGSSTFGPSTGFGTKNSRQTETRSCSSAYKNEKGELVFEIYTFPHSQDDELKITLTPQDASGQAIAAKFELPSVPIHLNYITECKGHLFNGESTLNNFSFPISINKIWKGTNTIEF